MRTRLGRPDLVAPILVGLVSFVVSMRLAAPGLTWLDGGELALGVGTMGVAHPPGEPIYLALAKLLSLLPVGDLPFRLTLFAALCSALASGLLTRLTFEIIVSAPLAGAGEPDWGSGAILGGAFAGLTYGLAPGVQLQAVRPELYSLMGLLLISAVWLIYQGGRRGLALAVIPCCLAGAVHHAMLVAAIPGLALLSVRRGRGSLKAGLSSAALLLPSGLLLFAWLPLRSFTDPALDFGSPRTLERVLWSVTGRSYSRSFNVDTGTVLDNLQAHAQIFSADLGIAALGLAFLGAALSFRRSPVWSLGCLLIVLVGVMPTALQGVFSADNPDARGYLLAVYATLASAAGLGASSLCARLRAAAPRLVPLLAGVLGLALLVPLSSGGLAAVDHSGRFLPARLGNQLLHDAQPGAVLFLAGDSWTFPAMYARYWEGRRPDVEVRPLYTLDEEVIQSLARRDLTLRTEELLRDDLLLPPSARPEILLSLLAAAPLDGRPVQVGEAYLPAQLAARRRPSGLLYSFDATPTSAGGIPSDGAPAPRPAGLWPAGLVKLRDDPRFAADPIGSKVLSRALAARAGYHLELGRPTEALQHYRWGSALAIDPWDMVHLLRSRLEQGQRAVPPRPPEGLVRAERLLLSGMPARASSELAQVLGTWPHHPRGLQLAERLYSLGHRVDRARAAP